MDIHYMAISISMHIYIPIYIYIHIHIHIQRHRHRHIHTDRCIGERLLPGFRRGSFSFVTVLNAPDIGFWGVALWYVGSWFYSVPLLQRFGVYIGSSRKYGPCLRTRKKALKRIHTFSGFLIMTSFPVLECRFSRVQVELKA